MAGKDLLSDCLMGQQNACGASAGPLEEYPTPNQVALGKALPPPDRGGSGCHTAQGLRECGWRRTLALVGSFPLAAAAGGLGGEGLVRRGVSPSAAVALAPAAGKGWLGSAGAFRGAPMG